MSAFGKAALETSLSLRFAAGAFLFDNHV